MLHAASLLQASASMILSLEHFPAAEAPAAEPQAAPGFTAVETDELPF